MGKALTFHGFENRRVARHNRHPAVASHLDLHPVRMFQIPNRLPAFPDNAALVSSNVHLETRFFFALVFTVRLCSVFLGLLGVLFRLVSASRVVAGLARALTARRRFRRALLRNIIIISLLLLIIGIFVRAVFIIRPIRVVPFVRPRCLGVIGRLCGCGTGTTRSVWCDHDVAGKGLVVCAGWCLRGDVNYRTDARTHVGGLPRFLGSVT